MKNDINEYKNPTCKQYVAPFGWHFVWNGQNQGRIIWRSNVDGYTIEED